MGSPQILWGPLGPYGNLWDPLGSPGGVPQGPRGGIEVGVQQESCSNHYSKQLSCWTPTLIHPLGPEIEKNCSLFSSNFNVEGPFQRYLPKTMTKKFDLDLDLFFEPGFTWKAVWTVTRWKRAKKFGQGPPLPPFSPERKRFFPLRFSITGLLARDGTIVQLGVVRKPHPISQMIFFRLLLALSRALVFIMV